VIWICETLDGRIAFVPEEQHSQARSAWTWGLDVWRTQFGVGYAPKVATGLSPGFQPWDPQNKRVRPEAEGARPNFRVVSTFDLPPLQGASLMVVPRVETLGFIHNLEGTADNWKTSLGAKEHRLEAYATLIFRTVERFLRSIPEAISVNTP
jgi:hypothetical protein